MMSQDAQGGGEDYYSDSTPPATPPNEAQEPQEPDEAGETALLPKSLFGGKECKPGMEVTFKIVRLHDDEVEVARASGESEEPAAEEAAEPPQAQADAGDEEMSSMMG